MNTELIGQAWDKLSKHEDQFVRLFYERLFQTHPDYKPLFSESREREMVKMVEAVAMVARVSGDSEVTHPRLTKLGQLHSHYQLKTEDLQNFKQVYLQVLKEACGADWIEECGIAWSEAFEERIIPFMSEGLGSVAPRTQKMQDLNKRTSVRNQLLGTVVSIKPRMYHGEVTLRLKGGEQLLAILTLESIKKLGLAEGSEAHILIRASHLIIVKVGAKLKFSAANHLCGTVVGFNQSRLSTEIVLQLKGGDMLKTVVPQAAIEDLGIQIGETVCGVLKATNVILATEE
jgi:molybdopterin-binding protein